MTRTALLVGATGLVGSHVLDALLEHPLWSRVVVLGRRPTGKQHEKLLELLVNFEDLPPLERVDDVFACLGTTIRVAGSQERFRAVDHDYTLNAARAAHSARARRMALVSSVGASAAASSFYLRVKGETERDVRELGFESLVIARPSLLVGQRAEVRTGERVALGLSCVFAPLLAGPLRPYRPIDARDVGRALVVSLAEHERGERLLDYTELTVRARRVGKLG
jgi:uncharacterized protein YbjT (DUF2867 family)